MADKMVILSSGGLWEVCGSVAAIQKMCLNVRSHHWTISAVGVVILP